MKAYMKPETKNKKLKINEHLSSLNEWLEDNQLNDAGITTYIVNS